MNKQNNYFKPYSSNINNKVKVKRVRKKNANTRKHLDVLSKRKPKNSAKNLSAALQELNDPLKNELKYTNNKRASKPNLPHVVEPSKLPLPTNLTKPCLL